MQPTEKQKLVIAKIAGTIQSWAGSNDIDSPTHYSDISEDLRLLALDNVINDEETSFLANKLSELLELIQDLK